jgi:hypothetical protein
MRLRNTLLRYIFVMVVSVGLLTLASCRTSAETPTAVSTVPLPLRDTSTPQAPAIGTATPLLLTKASTSTLTPPAITPTLASATSTISPTPKPTLTRPQLNEYAIQLLKNNGGCNLPCWWGIVLGEAKLQDVTSQFGAALVTPRGAHFVILGPDNVEDYDFSLGFTGQDQSIQAIEVRWNVNEAVLSNRFTVDWQRFSLDQILSKYGQPTHVELQVKPPLHPNSPPSYLMWIVYENHGFWILYAGRSTYDGKIMHICPSLKTTFGLDLRLQSPESSVPVFQPEPGAGTRSLEEATGMSLEKFYNTFKNAKEKACLDSASTLPQEP